MPSRAKMVLAVLLLLMGGVIAWEVLRTREPDYQGRTLSAWLEDARMDWDSPKADPRTETALRAMGPRALPALVNLVRVRESLFRKALMELSSRQLWPRTHIRPRNETQSMAYFGFMVLGPAAKPAVPALVRCLGDADPEVRCLAAHCLGLIGPEAQDAVPELTAYLRRTLTLNTGSIWDENERYAAAFALCQIGPAARPAIPELTTLSTMTNGSVWRARAGICSQAALIRIKGASVQPLIEVLKSNAETNDWNLRVLLYLGTNAEPAIPVLLTSLQQTNIHRQSRIIEALGKIHAQPEVCLPALSPFLQSTNAGMRILALKAIRAFGATAKGAAPMPELVRCLRDPDVGVRAQATNAIRQVDPEAAAAAGVK
jgi:HEAT repeat protein